MHCDNTEERFSRFFYHTKGHLASFSEKKNVGGGGPFYFKFWVNRPPLSEIADFEPIFARSAAAATAKRIKLTLIGSRQRAFQ